MGLDDVIAILVYVVLILGVACLVLARGYIRRKDLLFAAETLWYATLALVICLALTFWSLHWRVRRDIAEIWTYFETIEHRYGGGDE